MATKAEEFETVNKGYRASQTVKDFLDSIIFINGAAMLIGEGNGVLLIFSDGSSYKLG